MKSPCFGFEHLSRRSLLKGTVAVAGGSLMNWGSLFSSSALSAEVRKDQKRCILLWMNGGASQFETFDMKPGRPTGGLFRPIATNLPGCAGLRTDAQDGSADGQTVGDPLDAHIGNRSSRGHPPDAYRLRSRRPTCVFPRSVLSSQSTWATTTQTCQTSSRSRRMATLVQGFWVRSFSRFESARRAVCPRTRNRTWTPRGKCVDTSCGRSWKIGMRSTSRPRVQKCMSRHTKRRDDCKVFGRSSRSIANGTRIVNCTATASSDVAAC